jgi:hypothetical protein
MRDRGGSLVYRFTPSVELAAGDTIECTVHFDGTIEDLKVIRVDGTEETPTIGLTSATDFR